MHAQQFEDDINNAFILRKYISLVNRHVAYYVPIMSTTNIQIYS